MEELAAVLEGWCPECEGKLRIVEAGGFPGWLYGLHPAEPSCPYDLEDVEVKEWNRPSVLDEGIDRWVDSVAFANPGAIDWECVEIGCSKVYYTEATPRGDWVGP